MPSILLAGAVVKVIQLTLSTGRLNSFELEQSTFKVKT